MNKSVNVTATGPQPSVAVADMRGKPFEHSTTVSSGKLANAGGVVSCTAMVCVAVLLLPASSVAVKVRVMT